MLNSREQYPLEFAKTRVQLRSEKGIPTPRNPFLVVTQVYQKEGLRALYKGCGALVVVCRSPLHLHPHHDHAGTLESARAYLSESSRSADKT